MRYLLDTNIVLFILNDRENISIEIEHILTDYSNQIFVSSISLIEIAQLFRIGKIKSKKYKTSLSLIKAIEEELYFKILPFGRNHAEILTKMQITDGHNDPFDHSIIAQAISDKLMLVSSDKKFHNYTTQRLKFIYNQR